MSKKKPPTKKSITKVVVPAELWENKPDNHDYPAALSYLRLLTSPEKAQSLVDDLSKAPIELHPVKDILRSTGLPLRPVNDPAVQRNMSKIQAGLKLSPVLILRGDFQKGVAAVIADGYHRVCVSYHLSENEPVPCRIADGVK